MRTEARVGRFVGAVLPHLALLLGNGLVDAVICWLVAWAMAWELSLAPSRHAEDSAQTLKNTAEKTHCARSGNIATRGNGLNNSRLGQATSEGAEINTIPLAGHRTRSCHRLVGFSRAAWPSVTVADKPIRDGHKIAGREQRQRV
jgi:hypothetical protein